MITDSNEEDRKKGAAMTNEGGSGCFSAVVRLLLCKGHLQTHPSDHIPDPTVLHTNRSRFIPRKDLYFNCQDADYSSEITPTPAAAPPPGIVARLMGLDSLPPPASTNWRRLSAVGPDSVRRSRSVNFVDYLHHLDLSTSSSASFSHPHHRRVRTSSSFSEEVLTAQNHPDLLLLYLEDTTATTTNKNSSTNFAKLEKPKRTIGSKLCRSSEIGSSILVQSKQRREADRIKQGREDVRVRSKSKEKKSRMETEKKKKKKKVTAVATGAEKPNQSLKARGNEVTSPVVVGSVSQLKKKVHSHRTKCPMKPTVNKKEAIVECKFTKKIKNQKAITRIGNSSQSSVSSACSGKKRESKKSCQTRTSLASATLVAAGGKFECKPPAVNGLDSARYVTELAEADVKGRAWIEKKKRRYEYEWFEEICVELGQQLLDLLLGQAVEELCLTANSDFVR